MSQFHDRLKTLRDNCGKTQAEIADDIGITPQAISYYINGREPNFDILIKMANYFHCSVDYLLGVDDNKNKETFQNLSQNLEYVVSTLSRLEPNNSIIDSLFSVVLLISHFSEYPLDIQRDANSVLSGLNILLRNLSSTATLVLDRVFDDEEQNIDIRAYSNIINEINIDRKLATTGLSVYFASVVSLFTGYVEKTASSDDLVLIKNIYKMFEDSLDVKNLTKDLKLLITQSKKPPKSNAKKINLKFLKH